MLARRHAGAASIVCAAVAEEIPQSSYRGGIIPAPHGDDQNSI
jgi:hypothetical protein